MSSGETARVQPAEEAGRFDAPAALAKATAEDGTDLTLIRWMLSLDPSERFEVLQSGARSLALLLDARAER